MAGLMYNLMPDEHSIVDLTFNITQQTNKTLRTNIVFTYKQTLSYYSRNLKKKIKTVLMSSAVSLSSIVKVYL